METKTMLLIIAAVTVAIGGAGVAFKFVGGNRQRAATPDEMGLSRTKLMIKMIVLGLVLLFGLAAWFFFERGGG